MEPQQYRTDSTGSADHQASANSWQPANQSSANPLNTGSQPAGSPARMADGGSHMSTFAAASPVVAEDADLIENEWVVTVKAVIEENKADPYTQSKAITALRADYLKKRYNKDIKVPEN